jgi:fibronectin type 3 domain-containing protein
MNFRPKLGALCAALALAASSAQAAITKVLYVGNADNPEYSTFITTRYPGATWTQKATGLVGDNLIGGDLDRTATYDGVLQTEKTYLQSFDLIILGVPTTSGNLVDGVLGADWSAINKPILFQSSVVTRATGGRPGMTSGDNNTTFTFSTLTTAESTRVSTTALSDSLLAGVTDPTNLYKSVSMDTIATIATSGGGERIVNFTDGTLTTYGIVYWNAGTTNSVGQTLAAKRAFMPIKASSLVDLTADGLIVLGNLIDQLAISSAPVQLPPSAVSATAGMGQVSLSWTAADSAASYQVKRATTSGGPYTTISTAGAVTGTTYVDSAVTNETFYYYVVSAVSAGATESNASAEVSALPFAAVEPSKKILYVGGTVDNVPYRTFLTTGRYANNQWTFKPSGLGDDQIGGALDRAANFDGLPTTPKAYLETFDLIIVSVPNTSGNFVDDPLGAQWSALTKPVLMNACSIARQFTGASNRTAFFTGDNFSTITFTSPAAESVRLSTSALSDALFSGVAVPSDLYSLPQVDTLLNLAAYGNGDLITSHAGTQTLLTVTTNVTGHGIVFWAAGSTSPFNYTIAANRAFYPLKNGLDDLSGSGKQVLINLVKQIGLPQVVLPPVVNTPTALAATAGEGRVDLTWTPASSASYIVKRATLADGPYTTLGTGTATSYSDTTAVGGTTYFYVVSSFNAATTPNESANSNQATATPTAPALTAPSALLATAGVNAVDLSWTAGAGAVSFNIKRATVTGGPYITLSSGTVTGTTYTDSSAVGGTTYFYVVSGVDATAAESSDSNEASATAIIPLTAIESWRVSKFGSPANTGDGADDADPDTDGRSNLLEYATGSEPLTADSGSPAILGRSVGGKLTLTFTRIADPALTYVVRGSNDLAAVWNETPVLNTTGAANVAGSVTAEDAELLSARPRRFLRLEVSR